MSSNAPPPQAVLDQRWLWQFLMVLLGITFGLRFLGLDIAGAMLTGMILCFAVVMTQDSMQELSKYSLVFAVLCSLNFMFDVLPLLIELDGGGRMERDREPGQVVSSEDGVVRATIVITTKVTPFFDTAEGFVYNVQSAAMIASPICMALGVYLAASAQAHIAIANQDAGGWEDDASEAFGHSGPGAGTVNGVSLGGLLDAAGTDWSQSSASSRGCLPPDMAHFQGTAHKLST